VVVLLNIFMILLAQLGKKANALPHKGDKSADFIRFVKVTASMWAFVGLALFAMYVYHWQDYSFTVTATIMGLFLMPLSKIFATPIEFATGALLVVSSLITILFVHATILPFLTCMLTGTILWLSAGSTICLGMLANKAPQGIKAPRQARVHNS